MTDQSVPIPMAFVVTYSIEYNHPGGRTARHMSMSVMRDGRVPHPAGVWMVCEELGFHGSLRECTVWLEDLSDGGSAVNVVQLLDAGAGHA